MNRLEISNVRVECIPFPLGYFSLLEIGGQFCEVLLIIPRFTPGRFKGIRCAAQLPRETAINRAKIMFWIWCFLCFFDLGRRGVRRRPGAGSVNDLVRDIRDQTHAQIRQLVLCEMNRCIKHQLFVRNHKSCFFWVLNQRYLGSYRRRRGRRGGRRRRASSNWS